MIFLGFCSSKDSLKLLSYNAYQMGIIKADERFNALKEKLMETDSDIVCLQEIWNDKEIFEVIIYINF